MCGILGIVVHDGVAELREPLINGLRAVEYRGYDSSGVAVLKPNGIAAATCADCGETALAGEPAGSMGVWKRAGKIAVLEKHLGDDAADRLGGGIGHTRWATHGGPSEENAHPHLDCASASRSCTTASSRTTSSCGRSSQASGHKFRSRDRHRGRRPPGRARCYDGRPGERGAPRALERLEGAYASRSSARDEPDMIVRARKDCRRSSSGIGEGENFVASRHPAPCWPTPASVRLPRRRRDRPCSRATAYRVIDAARASPCTKRDRAASTGTSSRPRRAATSTSCSRRSTSSREASRDTLRGRLPLDARPASKLAEASSTIADDA